MDQSDGLLDLLATRAFEGRTGATNEAEWLLSTGMRPFYQINSRLQVANRCWFGRVRDCNSLQVNKKRRAQQGSNLRPTA